MVYYNPYRNRKYNPVYTPTRVRFFIAQLVHDLLISAFGEAGGSSSCWDLTYLLASLYFFEKKRAAKQKNTYSTVSFFGSQAGLYLIRQNQFTFIYII